MQALAAFDTNWCAVPFATASWARSLFPAEDPAKALRRLRRPVEEVTLAAAADPVSAWRRRSQALKARARRLTTKKLRAIVFRSPTVDLSVPLIDGHVWHGGEVVSSRGIRFVPNLPTEEVYTVPDCRHVRGRAFSRTPLHDGDVMIENIAVTLENGRVTSATASSGQAALDRLLQADDGACRLGEVALVSATSLVGRTATVFRETLLDENAGCHVAFGQALAHCLAEAGQTEGAGFNTRSIHIDWMIGTPETDVFGIGQNEDGERLMKDGEWLGDLA